MQNTRLTQWVERTNTAFNQGLRNPWRRLSVLTISLLFGNYLGTAISTTAGQKAELDIAIAAILVSFTELISWVIYNSRKPLNSVFWAQTLNAMKIGFIYSLYVEAFKLGS